MLLVPEAVIYTRVSSREQEQEGFSLGAQSKLLREYADGNGIHIVKAFEDIETAKAPGRKQFSDMVTWFKESPSCCILLVEKTDRLYRNFRDAVTLEDLDIEIHLVKEGSILSKDSKSQIRLIHGIHLVMARNYSENLREEVKKGMREKASRGIYPGHAPFGYRNNRADRTIEIDPIDSPIVKQIFVLYATGSHSLDTLVKTIYAETGKRISRNNMHLILKNHFYIGHLKWGGQTYSGTHPLFLDPALFERVQSVLTRHNRRDYLKRKITFRRLMRCAYDGCMVTGEIQKEKHVYYRCTGNHGKCDLPRFREEDIAERLGEPLKCLQTPEHFASQIISTIWQDRRSKKGRIKAERARRIFELANKAHALYVSHAPLEKGKLLQVLFSNCLIDADHVMPIFREPFDMIFKKASLEEWSQYPWDLAPPILAASRYHL